MITISIYCLADPFLIIVSLVKCFCFFSSLVSVFKFEQLSSSFHCEEEEEHGDKAENHLAEGPATIDDGPISGAAAQVTCRAYVRACTHTQQSTKTNDDQNVKTS